MSTTTTTEIDPDDVEFTAEHGRRAKRLHDMSPEMQALLSKRGRGPQKAATKVPVTMRLSPDVVAGLRATGKGWQGRVDAILREAVLKQKSRAKAA